MPRSRRVHALFALAFAACARSAVPHAVPPTPARDAVAPHKTAVAPNPPPADVGVDVAVPVAPAPATAARPAATVDDTPAVRRVCAEQTGRARERIAAAFQEDHGDVWIHARDLISFHRCYPSPRGAWFVSLDALRWTPAHPVTDASIGEPSTLRGRYTIAYVSPDGTITRMAGAPRTIVAQQVESHAVSVVGSSDLDGDGVSELLYAATYAANESSDEDTFRPIEIATFHAGAVEPYAPLGTIRAQHAEDYDSDRRLDLRVASEFTAPSGTCGGLNPAIYDGPSRLYHTQLDGTFSDNDAAAAAALRDACPTAPTQLVAPSTHETQLREGTDHGMDSGATVERIACARYWDQPPADVVRRLRAEYPTHATTCLTLAELIAVAQTPTASTLRLR